MSSFSTRATGCLFVLFQCFACSASKSGSGASTKSGSGGTATASGAGGTASGGVPGGSSGGASSSAGTGATGIILDDAGTAGAPSDGDCMPNLTGTVRDFTTLDDDFQEDSVAMEGSPAPFAITLGLVQPDLVNGAPVLAVPTPLGAGDVVEIISPDTFSKWYSTSHPDDRTFLFNVDDSNGILTKTVEGNKTIYESGEFFPIDDVANAELLDGINGPHNFLFTFELNTRFQYNAGDVFEFRGDDDLWVFINGKLAVDVGGVHTPQDGMIALDTLGLTPGEEYPLSVFQAERHTSQSNFKITTSLKFTNCEPIIRPK